jgi:microcystin-dependent protein
VGTVEQITKCKWPAKAGESSPQLKRHWLYDAAMLNRAFGDFIFRVTENGITGNDFKDGTIPESKFDVALLEDLTIGAGAITVRKLANESLPANATGRAKMADDFVTTAKIKDAQVTAAKLATAVGAYAPPIGMIGKFAGEVPPTDWLECTGASVKIADYPALFAALGTYWGTAASGYFKLPDLRGYFSRGWAHGTTNDPDKATRTGGDHVGSTQADGFVGHLHSEAIVVLYLTAPARSPSGPVLLPFNNTDANYGATTANTGAETRPINKAVMYCIRAK